MLKRFAPIGLFLFFATCGGACQNLGQSLPDAPSAQAATVPEWDVSQSRVRVGALGSADVWRQSAFISTDKGVSNQERSNTFLGKYLNPAVPRRGSSAHLSDSGTMMGRATNAAWRIFLTRDDAGRERVNTSYFLRALTSVAADTASRPYWRRSATGPVSDLGSTVGNDAGMNLLREFEPGIQHLVKSHAPKFVARMIQERVSRN